MGLVADRNLERTLAENSMRETSRQELLLRLFINFDDFKWNGPGQRCDDDYIASSAYILQGMGFIPQTWRFNAEGIKVYSEELHAEDLEALQSGGVILKLEQYVLNGGVRDAYYKKQFLQKDKMPPECVRLLMGFPSEIVWRLAQVMGYSESEKKPLEHEAIQKGIGRVGVSNFEYMRARTLYRKLKRLDPRTQVLL